jgi:predicted RNase H-like nuclease (RuvC/YqgF family)
MWKVPASNQVYADINILDTPAGRILNTLYEAGGIIGYSSRAGGTLNPKKGYTEVDENTYNFVTFDAVPYPSVESARPPVVEGVEIEPTKTQLSNDVHEKLCKIISESSSSSLEALKDIIYNLDGYDLSREIALLEGKEYPSSPISKNEPTEGTTLFLLKESSLQIDRLRSANQTLQTAKDVLEEENASLKEQVNSYSSQVKHLSESVDSADARINESVSRSNDTIRGLQNQISELKMDIQDKDSEIELLESTQEAARALREENRSLKHQLVFNESSKVSNEALEKTQKELDEAVDEVALLISEASEKDSEIKRLSESITELQNTIQELQVSSGILEQKLSESSAKSSKLDESVQRTSSLEQENASLRRKIDEITESLDRAESKSDSYRDELISIIAAGYNLTVESVKSSLPVGFKKSDIYNVCESMSNTMSSTNTPYPIVIEESSFSQKTQTTQKDIMKPKFSDFVDRRGRGLK